MLSQLDREESEICAGVYECVTLECTKTADEFNCQDGSSNDPMLDCVAAIGDAHVRVIPRTDLSGLSRRSAEILLSSARQQSRRESHSRLRQFSSLWSPTRSTYPRISQEQRDVLMGVWRPWRSCYERKPIETHSLADILASFLKRVSLGNASRERRNRHSVSALGGWFEDCRISVDARLFFPCHSLYVAYRATGAMSSAAPAEVVSTLWPLAAHPRRCRCPPLGGGP